MLVDMHHTEIHQNYNQAPLQVTLRKDMNQPRYASPKSLDPAVLQPNGLNSTQFSNAAYASNSAGLDQNTFKQNGLDHRAIAHHQAKPSKQEQYSWTADDEIIDADTEDSSDSDQSGFDLDKFVQKLDKVKARASSQRCARSIRIALQSAGAVFGSHPVAASDWGGTLAQIGFKQIQPEFDHPQEGDIYIIRRTNKHVYGHIAGFNGSQWVSDFKQKSYDVYKEDGLKYEYYRLNF